MKATTINALADKRPEVRSCLEELNELGRLIRNNRRYLRKHPLNFLELSLHSLEARRQVVRQELRKLSV